MDYETLTLEAKHNAAIEAEEYNLVAVLKPRIFIDGNQWGVLYGDTIQDGVAGFGETAYLAVLAFNKAWEKPVSTHQRTNP